MQGDIIFLIIIGYVIGLSLIGLLAYLGIKGTNESIEFNNRQIELTKSFKNNKN